MRRQATFKLPGEQVAAWLNSLIYKSVGNLGSQAVFLGFTPTFWV